MGGKNVHIQPSQFLPITSTHSSYALPLHQIFPSVSRSPHSLFQAFFLSLFALLTELRPSNDYNMNKVAHLTSHHPNPRASTWSSRSFIPLIFMLSTVVWPCVIMFTWFTHKRIVNKKNTPAKASKTINRGSNPSKPFDNLMAFSMKGSTVAKTKAVKMDVAKQKFMKNLWFLAPTQPPIPVKMVNVRGTYKLESEHTGTMMIVLQYTLEQKNP